jgi:hypothetical protein
MEGMLLRTGLNQAQVTAIMALMNEEDAVIFGSTVTFAYLDQDTMGEDETGPLDIDFLCKDQDVVDSLLAVICQDDEFSAPDGCPGTEYSSYSLNFPEDTSLMYDIENQITSVQITSAPNEGETMGTIDWTLNTFTADDSAMNSPFTAGRTGLNGVLLFSGGEAGSDANNGYTAIGLHMPGDGSNNEIRKIQFVVPETFGDISQYADSLVDFVAATADFTVSAGTFDGTTIHMPYEDHVNYGFTIYREVVGGLKSLDWMLYRLNKWIARGFTVFFENQQQIDAWDQGFWGYALGYPGEGDNCETLSFWYTDLDCNSGFDELEGEFTYTGDSLCPFKLTALCECDNGTPAVPNGDSDATLCTGDFAQDCMDCDDGYVLDSEAGTGAQLCVSDEGDSDDSDSAFAIALGLPAVAFLY